MKNPEENEKFISIGNTIGLSKLEIEHLGYHSEPYNPYIKRYLMILVLLFTILFLVFCVFKGLKKEAHRMDSVYENNCKYYSVGINKMAGSDVCPPTVHG